MVLNNGGERGIRTLDTGISPYASLAGKCLRPLGQLSRSANDTLNCFKNQFLALKYLAQKLYEAPSLQALNISHL
jgi:hypothetical protein